MKIWIVLDHDYDNSWIVAAYPTAEMASEHERLMGGDVESVEVRDTLHPDATDPTKQVERAAEADKQRRDWEDSQARQEVDAKRRKETRPCPPRMRLCHCQTSSSDGWLVNEHGYCGYCGGFMSKIFREHMGDVALHAEIDKLTIHDREKMRKIVTSPDE